jgi:hypothetical protein
VARRERFPPAHSRAGVNTHPWRRKPERPGPDDPSGRCPAPW